MKELGGNIINILYGNNNEYYLNINIYIYIVIIYVMIIK